MQRLYSGFARGWPGAGLLCLRLVAAITALHYVVSAMPGEPLLAKVIEGTAGLLLCAGLWTPVAGTVLAAFELSSLFSNGDPWSQILLATVSIALAMLGPGAWSVDSRLYGRKRLIPPSRSYSKE